MQGKIEVFSKYEAKKMRYKVSATIHGNRIKTSTIFHKKSTAQRYANETNMYFVHANARVIKLRRMK